MKSCLQRRLLQIFAGNLYERENKPFPLPIMSRCSWNSGCSSGHRLVRSTGKLGGELLGEQRVSPSPVLPLPLWNHLLPFVFCLAFCVPCLEFAPHQLQYQCSKGLLILNDLNTVKAVKKYLHLGKQELRWTETSNCFLVQVTERCMYLWNWKTLWSF